MSPSTSTLTFVPSTIISLPHTHRVHTRRHPQFRVTHRTRPQSCITPATSSLAFQPPATATSNLQRFLTWFIGDFDNFYQVDAETRAGVSYRERHEHMHCRLTPVLNDNLTTSGETVVFANYYYNGNPQIVYRQRMYKLIDREHCIEMRIYKMTYIHGLRVSAVNANFSAFELGNLDDPELYQYLTGAEVFWNYEENPAPGTDFVSNGPHFVGTMQPGGWKSPENLTIDDRLVLTKEDLWVAERMFNNDGVMVAGNREGIPHKMQRVRPADEIKWTLDDTVPPVVIPE